MAPRMSERMSSQGLFAELSTDIHAMYGEFVGTVLFLLFALGAVQAQSTASGESGTAVGGDTSTKLIGLYFISAGFGLSLFAVANIFYRFTGSIFNPNVAFSLLLAGVIKPVRFVLVVLAQFVGAIVASAILDGLTPGPLAVNVALGTGTSRTQGLFIEMFVTSALCLSVLMLAAEKSKLTPTAPLGFGMMLFACELFSVEFTGGSLNTARAFGPACIQGFQHYHWIYWLGPTLGALLATAFYYLLKYIKYWEINPGQLNEDPKASPLQDLPGESQSRLNSLSQSRA